jgi:hypothetical protein
MTLPIPKSLALAAAALLLLAPNPARASLIGQTVGVTLTDGGSLSLSQNVVVSGSGPEIAPGDGSPIGGVLQPTESVDLGAESISLSLEEGAPGGMTGYPSGTHYTFSNLVFLSQSTEIVGVNVTTTNLSDLGPVTFTGDSVSVPIDNVKIGDLPPPEIDTGSLTITLDIVAVPEPTTGALAAGGLALLGALRRSRARAS